MAAIVFAGVGAVINGLGAGFGAAVKEKGFLDDWSDRLTGINVVLNLGFLITELSGEREWIPTGIAGFIGAAGLILGLAYK